MWKLLRNLALLAAAGYLVWSWQSGEFLTGRRKPPPPPPTRATDGSVLDWAGTWRNNRAGTTGALACRLEASEGGSWHGVFRGNFKDRTFEYTAYMDASQRGQEIHLSGNTDVDDDDYKWIGRISGRQFWGSFESDSGNHGEFELRRR